MPSQYDLQALIPPRTIEQLPTEAEIVSGWSEVDVPRVSICCITYSHESFISDAMGGFLIQQTNFPFEIIVHDDASTDGTAEVIRRYQQQYPTIVKSILQTANQYSQGRKVLPIVMAEAGGEYIAFCEGDDYWTDPQKLSKQVAFLDKHPQYVICGHDAFAIDTDYQLVRESKFPRGRKDATPPQMVADRDILLSTNTYLFRKPIEPLPVEFYRIISADRFLVSWLSQFGGSKYLDSVLPNAYRVHQGGMWSSISESKTRQENNANLYFWLYRYFDRIGKRVEARRCLERHQEMVAGYLGASLFWRLPIYWLTRMFRAMVYRLNGTRAF